MLVVSRHELEPQISQAHEKILPHKMAQFAVAPIMGAGLTSSILAIGQLSHRQAISAEATATVEVCCIVEQKV